MAAKSNKANMPKVFWAGKFVDLDGIGDKYGSVIGKNLIIRSLGISKEKLLESY